MNNENYDPNVPNRPQPRFDPETGKPLFPESTSAPRPKFDPYTGEPIVYPEVPQPRFDPMTGEPLQPQQEAMFQPQQAPTPQPAAQADATPRPQQTPGPAYTPQPEPAYTPQPEPTYAPQPEPAFTPQSEPAYTPQPETQPQPGIGVPPIGTPPVPPTPNIPEDPKPAGKKSRKTTGIILGVIGGLVVLLAIAAVLLLGNFFSSPNKKVLEAATKTLTEQNAMSKSLDTKAIISDEFTYTIDGSYSAEGMSMNGTCSFMYTKNGYGADIRGSFGGNGYSQDIDATLVMNKDQILLHSSLIGDENFSYNYRTLGSGYLVNMAGPTAISSVNSTLALIYDAREKYADFGKFALEQYDLIKFEKAGSSEFTVDGQPRSCEGYVAKIDAETVRKIWQNTYDKYIAEDAQLLGLLGSDFDINEINNKISEVGSTEVKVYIYKGQLAAVIISDVKDSVMAMFKGGDFRVQNTDVYTGSVNNGMPQFDISAGPVYSITGGSNGSEMYMEIASEGIKQGKLTFDSNTNDITMEVPDMYTMGMHVESTSKDVTCTVTKMIVNGQDVFGAGNGSLTYKISKGAALPDISGNAVDIGNMTQEDVMSYIGRISGQFNPGAMGSLLG